MEKVPKFWNLLKDTIQVTEDCIQAYYVNDESRKLVNFEQANELILCLQLIESASLVVHTNLVDDLLELLPKLVLLLKHPLKAVRIPFLTICAHSAEVFNESLLTIDFLSRSISPCFF